MIGVANRERLGQRELKRNIGARVVAHHVRRLDAVGLAMGRQPVVHFAAVPGLVLHPPGMAGGGDFLRAGRAGVQMKRQQVAVRDFRHRADGRPICRSDSCKAVGSSKPRTPAIVPK